MRISSKIIHHPTILIPLFRNNKLVNNTNKQKTIVILGLVHNKLNNI